MKPRTTWILLSLVVFVGALVILDHYRGTSTEEAQEKSKHILDIQSGDVTRLELIRTNQTIVLEKTGDTWNILKPLSVRADDSAVNSVLSALEFAERNRTLSGRELAGMNPADFGLDPPQVEVTLQTKKGAVTLLVGGESATRDALYVQIQGRKEVDVTPKDLLQRLNTGLDSLRSHVAMDITPSAATRLELKSVERVIELAKSAGATNAEPRWAIVRPFTARADQRKVSDLLTELGALRVQDFVSDDPKDTHTYQLDEPEREITLWTGDAGKTLLIGHALTNDAAKVYAKLKGTDSIFTVAADAAKGFAAQVNDLRDPQVLAFDPTDVFGIDILQGTNNISLTRDNKGWNVALAAPVPADAQRVEQLLTRLGTVVAKRFAADVALDLDKYGLASPVATVTLRGQGTNLMAQLLIGGLDETGGVRYVKRADEPLIYGVESNIVEWLPANALALRGHRLAEIAPDQIRKLTIQNGPTRAVLERDAKDKWRLVEPAQGAIDNDGLQMLVDAFAQVRAEQFIREGRESLAEYGLDAPEFSITAQTGDKTYTLAVGKSVVQGLNFALWGEPPLVFTISTPMLAPLRKQIVVLAPVAETSVLTNATPSPGILAPDVSTITPNDAATTATNSLPSTAVPPSAP